MVEARLRATADPTCLLAVWLVGYEETAPEQSGEICVAELFGHALGAGGSAVRMGIKAHHDPRLRQDMADVALDIDATDWHTYAAAWTARETRFYVDDRLVRTVPQGLGYPLQLMVDLFEFPAGPVRDPAAYPKLGQVASVRGYEPASPDGT
jgi:beta-glucanase (GH16 family)